MKLSRIVESEYAGLEDNDEFVDLEADGREAHEVMHILHDTKVVNNKIHDKNGELEGLPDGRRFGSDIPIEIFTSKRDPGRQMVSLSINTSYVIVWVDHNWNTFTSQQIDAFRRTHSWSSTDEA